MKLEIKTIDDKQKILIVVKEKSFFVNLLKSQLEEFGGEVFYSPVFPKSLSSFDMSFIVNEKRINFLEKKSFKKIVFIFINQGSSFQELINSKLEKIKIISIKGDIFTKNDVDKILWFSFSKTKEKFLQLLIKKTVRQPRIIFLKPVYDLKRFFRPKSIAAIFISIFLIVQFFFFIPLTATSYFSYLTYSNLKNENYSQATDLLKWQKIFLSTTKKTYSFSHSTLLFLSLANVPDDLIEINEKVGLIIEKLLTSQKGLKEIIGLVLNKNKTANEKSLLILRLNLLRVNLQEIGDNLTIISNKLPANFPKTRNLKKSIVSGIDYISQTKKIISFIDEILGKDGEKKYLLLFANNMELRPGGGFIGSFGILTTKDYTLKEIKIYDVYDADGQLIAHIEPPPAIRTYLGQPHWFLRDSAFSADFLENYNQAKFFLEKELSLVGFSGGALITTSAIEKILAGFDNIYLPDFKETVNSKNFYLKAQYFAEKNFFPGSIQKKTFLSSLFQQIILNLETVSLKKLTVGIKKSLDEKQLVVNMENPALQTTLESLFWAGRIIQPKCINAKNCVLDFLMPVDANLGVNKANFFISRLITLKTYFESDGSVNHTLSIVFKNESPSEVFPGGSYKNYFQVYLPQNISIKSITKNGVLIGNDLITEEIKLNWFKIIGVFFEVKPKSVTELKINYQLNNQFETGSGTYQLVVQKQIGSANNDFVSEVHLTKNYYLLNQNFIPLVKDNQILYNTYLSTDKIFFIELVKEEYD